MGKAQEKDKLSELTKTERSIIKGNTVLKEFTAALEGFSEQADTKKPKDHRSYVYALCEKKENSLVPFYIGEGKGTRVWSHEFDMEAQMKILEEELAKENRLDELEERKQKLSEKRKKIDEIRKKGGEVVKYIIKWGMTADEAFMAESALINLLQIGGLEFKAGSDGLLTNIVQGHQSEGEKQSGSSSAARTVDSFCEEFAKEPLYFEDLKKKEFNALLININSGHPECLKFERGPERNKAIRDTVCGNWALPENEVFIKREIEYVFATVQSRIVGIYRIKEVNGKKVHNMLECVEKNSEYPHGKGTVPFRDGDYKNAKDIIEAANKKGKAPSMMELADMPTDYQEKFRSDNKDNCKKESAFAGAFKNAMKRKYMILEDLPETDPNKELFDGYMYRRIIHTEEWIKKTKKEKQEELKKALAEGKTENLPNPDKTTENIYGSGNPLRYLLSEEKKK